MAMRQRERLLRRLLRGSITQIQAYEELGIMRLASRIADLKSDGFPIQGEKKNVMNRYGEVCCVTVYKLGEDIPESAMARYPQVFGKKEEVQCG